MDRRANKQSVDDPIWICSKAQNYTFNKRIWNFIFTGIFHALTISA